ncbi:MULTISPECIES: porin [Burkholderiaceae]|uniref:porin n=1 Tax=Burkholderiaceae TaxID=119060 RepID=UPI0014214C84|nr:MULTISPECIES: porin [Burkholderiaceae]MBN3851140.1 porin [Paraburkholderia sp. Ac-20342]NIF51260.1 porin [Burkholderia sp. Ax-1724]
MKNAKYCAKIGMVSLAMTVPLVAHAQSSVTLYGILQSAVDFNHFSGTSSKPSSNGVFLTNESSFVGFRGTEDLGGGLAATFKLETWTSLANGQSQVPNVFFATESYVGLAKNTLGTLQFGRQYTPALWLTYAADPFGRAQNGAIYNLTQQIPPRNPIRGFIPTQNNAIQYISPVLLGGLTIRLMYAPSGSASAPTNLGEMTSASFDYRHGPLFVGGSYENARVAGSVASTTLATLSNTTYTMGASYDFNIVKLFGYFLQNRLQTQNTLDAYMVGVTIPIGLSVIKSSYEWRTIAHTESSGASVLAVGYYYPLSKRTVLFASYAHMHNSAGTAFGLWPSETAYNSQGLPANGMAITSVELGIQHRF